MLVLPPINEVSSLAIFTHTTVDYPVEFSELIKYSVFTLYKKGTTAQMYLSIITM